MPLNRIWDLISNSEDVERRKREFRSTVETAVQGAQREVQQGIGTAGRLAGQLGEGFAADARNIAGPLDFYNREVAAPFSEYATQNYQAMAGGQLGPLLNTYKTGLTQGPGAAIESLKQSQQGRLGIEKMVYGAAFDPLSIATGGLSGGPRLAANIGLGALQGAASGSQMTGGNPLATLAGGVVGGAMGSAGDLLSGLPGMQRNIAIPGSNTPKGRPSYAHVEAQAKTLGVPPPTKAELNKFYAAERAREKAAQTRQFNEWDQQRQPQWGSGTPDPNLSIGEPRLLSRAERLRAYDAGEPQVGSLPPQWGAGADPNKRPIGPVQTLEQTWLDNEPRGSVQLAPNQGWGQTGNGFWRNLEQAKQPKGPKAPPIAAQQVGRYNVGAVGTTGSQNALMQVDESLLRQGKMGDLLNRGPVRRLTAFLNPSVGQDRSVPVSAVAGQDVEAMLATRWTGTREQLINRVVDAFPSEPKYIGPAKEAWQLKRAGLVGAFHRPDLYDLTPEQRRVLLEVDQRNFDDVFVTAREEHGVKALPFDNGIPGSAYLPLIAKSDDPTTAANQFFQRTGLSGRTKQRVYQDVFQRMDVEPDFVPETNIRTLLEAHDNALARDAGLETFKLGVGKTAAEMDALKLPKDKWVWDEVTQRYLPSDAIKNQVQGILRERFGIQGADTALDVLDEIRGIHLGADLSPVTIQGGLAFAANPIGTIKQWRPLLNSILHGDTMAGYLQTKPAAVERYAFVKGSRAGAPPAELKPSGLLEKIPGMTGFNQRLSDVVEARVFDMWENWSATARQWDPSISQAVADREAYNAVAKLVGRIQFGEHGRSVLAQKVARGGITSPSFALAPAALVKDMFSGFAKLGKGVVTHPTTAWSELAPRERMALNLGLRAAGTFTAISVASAAAFAKANNRSEEEAIRDVLDPNSPRFWTLTVDKYNVPMGGPLRSFVKMVYGVASKRDADVAVRWSKSKLNAPVSVPIDLYRNEDYWGKPIMTGEDDGIKALQALWYATGNLAPISLGAVSEGARRGDPIDSTVIKGVGQVSGTNVMEMTPRFELDYLARGRFGSDYRTLEPHQQAQLKAQHPALWQEYMQAGTPQMQASWAERERILQTQLASDDRLSRGEIKYSQWKEDLSNRRLEERSVMRGIYADRTGKVNDPIMAKYFTLMDGAQHADGTMDWEAFEAGKAKLTPEEQAYIDRNTALGNTPTVQRYRDLQRQARPYMTEFMNTPAFLGLTVEESQQVSQLVQEASSYMQTFPKGTMTEKAAIARVARDKGVTGKILATAMNADRLRNPKRSQLWRSHPILEQVYGDLSPLQQAA